MRQMTNYNDRGNDDIAHELVSLALIELYSQPPASPKTDITILLRNKNSKNIVDP